MSLLLALIRRDLVLSLRQGGGAGTALGFFLTVVVLLPIGLGPDQALLQRLAPGALWIALLLSVLLSADRIFQQDYEDGSLDIMAMGPVPLELVALAKSLAHWLSTGLPLAVSAPLLGFLLNLDPAVILPLILAMALGSVALSLLAAVGAAVELHHVVGQRIEVGGVQLGRGDQHRGAPEEECDSAHAERICHCLWQRQPLMQWLRLLPRCMPHHSLVPRSPVLSSFL